MYIQRKKHQRPKDLHILVAASAEGRDFYKPCQGEPEVVACRKRKSSKITGTTARSRSPEQEERGEEVAAAAAGWWNVSLRRPRRLTMRLVPMAVAQVSLNSPTKPVSTCINIIIASRLVVV